jgi:hypothetical protein
MKPIIILLCLFSIIFLYNLVKIEKFTIGSQENIYKHQIKSNKKVLLVPNSDGNWNITNKYPLHKSLYEFAITNTPYPIAYGDNTEHENRQQKLYDVLKTNFFEVMIGHSEGGARVLHCAAENKLNNIKYIILISPSYSTTYIGSVDIDSAITNLKNVSVLLIDTDTGWGGADKEHQWSERIKLTKALEGNKFGDKSLRVFISGSDHYLKTGYQTAMEYIINFINNN